jgi:hypothetical protein
MSEDTPKSNESETPQNDDDYQKLVAAFQAPSEPENVPRGTIKKKKKVDGRINDPRLEQDKRTIKILELSAKGMNNSQIAQVVDMSPSGVKKIADRFKSVFTELEKVEEYRNIKADILSAGQLAALKSAFSGNKLAKAGFLSTIQGFDLLNKAERLERNLSTENVNTQVFGQILVENVVKGE